MYILNGATSNPEHPKNKLNFAKASFAFLNSFEWLFARELWIIWKIIDIYWIDSRISFWQLYSSNHEVEYEETMNCPIKSSCQAGAFDYC